MELTVQPIRVIEEGKLGISKYLFISTKLTYFLRFSQSNGIGSDHSNRSPFEVCRKISKKKKVIFLNKFIMNNSFRHFDR